MGDLKALFFCCKIMRYCRSLALYIAYPFIVVNFQAYFVCIPLLGNGLCFEHIEFYASLDTAKSVHYLLCFFAILVMIIYDPDRKIEHKDNFFCIRI